MAFAKVNHCSRIHNDSNNYLSHTVPHTSPAHSEARRPRHRFLHPGQGQTIIPEVFYIHVSCCLFAGKNTNISSCCKAIRYIY